MDSYQIQYSAHQSPDVLAGTCCPTLESVANREDGENSLSAGS